MIVDVNVYLSRWPTRRLPYDEPARLVQKLKGAGITQAWAGSFDGLLHKDVGSVNARLVEDCKQHGDGLLIPFGSLNPTLPDWQEEVRRCAEDHAMPGIRLTPNYHGYELDKPVFSELASLAVRHNLIVQVAVKMEDERTQHRLLRMPPVNTKPLLSVLADQPKLKLVILNGLRTIRDDDIRRLSDAGQVWFEISMQEGVGGVARLLQHLTLDRILFGSYFPFFYLESSLLKLRESNLANFQLQAIRHGNAESLLPRD